MAARYVAHLLEVMVCGTAFVSDARVCMQDAPPLKRARKKSQMARSPFFSSRGIGICETLE